MAIIMRMRIVRMARSSDVQQLIFAGVELQATSVRHSEWLDGTPIGRAERIRALQDVDGLRRRIIAQEAEYAEKREEQKRKLLKETTQDHAQQATQHSVHQHYGCSVSEEDAESWKQDPNTESHPNQNLNTDVNSDTLEEREFWEKPCAFTPESRMETHRHLEEKRRLKEKMREPKTKTKPHRTLITAEGRVLNINEAKLDFTLNEDEDNNCVLLDLHVYRHLDTSLLDLDLQPTYVRVTVKGKVFQLVLPDEVKPDSSTAQRSQTTGHLVLTMPKAQGEIKVQKAVKLTTVTTNKLTEEEKARMTSGCERLEVDPSKCSTLDLANIVAKENHTTHGPLQLSRQPQPCGAQEKPVSKEFVDDPEVPPLI